MLQTANGRAYNIREAKQPHTVAFLRPSIWTLLTIATGITINIVSLTMLETPTYVQKVNLILVNKAKALAVENVSHSWNIYCSEFATRALCDIAQMLREL